MRIQIQSIHFTLANRLKVLINKKLNKLFRINHDIFNTNVYLKIDNPESFSNKIVEIKLNTSSSIFFAKKTSKSFENSIDLVFQALRKQIIRNKQK